MHQYVILKSYLHIKTRHLVKIIPTSPTCFSLSRPSSGNFILPCFEVVRQPRNGTDTISTGRTPAKQHRYNLHSHTHAAAVPYIVSIEALATSKQGKIKLPEHGLDRLKHVGVV